jgi:hypothetical protein
MATFQQKNSHLQGLWSEQVTFQVLGGILHQHPFRKLPDEIIEHV